MRQTTHRHNWAGRSNLEGNWGGRTSRLRFLTWLLVIVTVGAAGKVDAVTVAQSTTPVNYPVAHVTPGLNALSAMNDQAPKSPRSDSPNQERKKQITEDSARLLKLANDLKAEVNKTSKDTLSLGVIRKADEIERLAHEVREKMKLTGGSN